MEGQLARRSPCPTVPARGCRHAVPCGPGSPLPTSGQPPSTHGAAPPGRAVTCQAARTEREEEQPVSVTAAVP